MTTVQTRQGEALTRPVKRPAGFDVVLFTWFALGTAMFGLGLLVAGVRSWAAGALLCSTLFGVFAWAARRADRAAVDRAADE